MMAQLHMIGKDRDRELTLDLCQSTQIALLLYTHLLYTYCTTIVHLLYTCCTPIVQLLYTYCKSIVYLLYSSCAPLVHQLYL